MSRQVEKMATLGPEASFSHQATINVINSKPNYTGAEIVFCKTIPDVGETLVTNNVRRAIIPIENSTDGPVKLAVPLFRKHPLRIEGELVLPIEQSAYYLEGIDPADIKYVTSIASAIGQVRVNAARLFPNAQFLEDRPSTIAAILEAATDPTKAGIGPHMAGDVYQLMDRMVRIDKMHDDPRNATRFLIVGIQDEEEITPTDNDKTSLIAQIPDRPGSLYKTLDLLVEEGVNLTKIMSYGGDGDYVIFWMDLDGHQDNRPLSLALRRLLKQGVGIKMLGSYPKYIYTPEYTDQELNMDQAIAKVRSEAANGTHPEEKTVVAFTLLDQIGALRNALEPFNRSGINLTGIDSLPTGVLGEYIFYLSFQNRVNQREEALEELKKQCTRLVLI